MAADSTTNRIYVTNSGNGTLAVLDGGTNTIVTNIPVGSEPHGVAVNPTTDRIYVANYASSTVSVCQMMAVAEKVGNSGDVVEPTVHEPRH